MIEQTYYKNILIEDETGSGTAEGYVCHFKDENWRNYLESILLEEDVKKIEKMFAENNAQKIAVFKNMYVDEESRGDGIGTELVECFLEEANEADFIILEADIQESNLFNLVNWYQSYGFKKIETSRTYDTVMVLDLKEDI